MSRLEIEIVSCGSPVHLADQRELSLRNLAIPHDHAAWPLHSTIGSWVWCRVLNPTGRLISGFAIHLTLSRAIPGTRIGRIDRVGRDLHAEIADNMGEILAAIIRKLPRVLRLDVRVFDEDDSRRQRINKSLAMAGWTAGDVRRQYHNTLVLPLNGSREEVLQHLSTRVRSTINKALNSPSLRFAPIVGHQYAERLRHLYELTFARTGEKAPPLDVRGIMQDAAAGGSLLVGVFAPASEAPRDLMAYLWSRSHGDHIALEINASERSPLFQKLSPGFALMYHMIDWGIQQRAKWIDLGGVSSLSPTPDDPLRGIIAFKSRFSTDLRTVAEEWHIAPSPLLAAAADAVRSIAKSVSGARHSL
jgi:hypothetical protein